MISDKFLSLVQRKLPFELTEVQQDVVRRIGTFLFHRGERQAYMLRGFAGTGKTFMVSAIVRVLHDLGREVVLLAPTGRAAKVLSQLTVLEIKGCVRRVAGRRVCLNTIQK